jgi:hypothetical protein
MMVAAMVSRDLAPPSKSNKETQLRRFFPWRLSLVIGAVGLAVALGVIGIVAIDEVDDAFAQGTENEFEGVIEALPAVGVVGSWQISGRSVTVTEATEIDREGHTLAVGLRVEVEGSTQADGSILASEIEVEDNDDD